MTMLDKNSEIVEEHIFQEAPKNKIASAFSKCMSEPAMVLRWGGATALILAVITFMFQGVYALDPMKRHWIMLGLCGGLALFGVGTGVLIKEEKGARVFLGFSAALFPVLASQLGAMIFSLFGSPPPGIPAPLLFTLENSSALSVVATITLLTTIPISYLAFRVLARSKASLLTWMFTMANFSILIPTRSEIGVGAVIALFAGALFWVDKAKLQKDFRLENFEGRISRLMLFLPLIILTARSFFYPMSEMFYGFLLIISGLYLAFHLGIIASNKKARLLCQFTGQLLIAAGWLSSLLTMSMSYYITDGMLVYIAVAPLLLSLSAQSYWVEEHIAKQYRLVVAVVTLLATITAHLNNPTLAVSVIGLFFGLAIIFGGTLVAEKRVCITGLITTLLGIAGFGFQTIQVNSDYVWLILAVAGVAVLLSASLFEKRHSLTFLGTRAMWGRLRLK